MTGLLSGLVERHEGSLLCGGRWPVVGGAQVFSVGFRASRLVSHSLQAVGVRGGRV